MSIRRMFDFWPLGLVPFMISLVLITVFGRIVDLKITQAQFELGAIEQALRFYESKLGELPSETEGLGALTRADVIGRVPQDPWGNAYLYRHDAGSHSILVYSPGLDHRDDGGAGDDVISGPKTYRCADYGVNCPPTVKEMGAWSALALAVISLVGGIVNGILPRTLRASSQ